MATRPPPPQRRLPPPPVNTAGETSGSRAPPYAELVVPVSPLAPRVSSSSTASDSSRLTVGALSIPPASASSRRSSRASSPLPPASPIGPPPSLPLPDLPPFPSPIDPHILTVPPPRSKDAPTAPSAFRPSLARRVSEGIIASSSPSSPTASVHSTAELSVASSSLSPHVSRRVASSASLGRRPARPLSTASGWSVASASSYVSAANQALGLSMAELDREADAMGILLPPPSPGPRAPSSRLSKSLGSSSSKRKHRSSYQRPSLPPSQTSPTLPTSFSIDQSLPVSSQPQSNPAPSAPTNQPPLRTSSSAPLLASTLRKVSLRTLYPPTASTDLPSPNEDDEAEYVLASGSPVASSSEVYSPTAPSSYTATTTPSSVRTRPRLSSSVATRSTRSSTASSLGSGIGSTFGTTPNLPPNASASSARLSLASSTSGSGGSFVTAPPSTPLPPLPPASSGSRGRSSRSAATPAPPPISATPGTASTSTSYDVAAAHQKQKSRSASRGNVAAAASARAALDGRTSPDVADMIRATPRRMSSKSSLGRSRGRKSRAGSMTGNESGFDTGDDRNRDSRGGDAYYETSASGVDRRVQVPGPSSQLSDAQAVKMKPLRASASVPAGLSGSGTINSRSMSVLSEPVPVPPLPPPSSFARSKHLTRRATDDGILAGSSTGQDRSGSVLSPTDSIGDEAWMTPDSGGEDGDDLARELGVGVASDSDESSIDLHTPLPHILVRDGMLSPSSTVVRSLATSTPGASSSKASKHSSSSPNAPLRKQRHRDGKLLREGVGLTTGLGWSDSEDENAPAPLKRRLSKMVLRRMASAGQVVSNTSSPRGSVVDLDAPSGNGKNGDSLRDGRSVLSQSTNGRVEVGKSILRKTTSSGVLVSPSLHQLTESPAGTPSSSRPNTPSAKSALSANPSLDAKVKALLARAEAYKKETQARIAMANANGGGSPGRSESVVSTTTPLAALLAASSTLSAAATGSQSRPGTGQSSTSTITERTVGRSASSSVSSAKPMARDAEEDALAAAEAAYRRSQRVSSSSSARYSAATRSVGSSKAPRASSSIGSRSSMYSTASSGVTEFGTVLPASQMSLGMAMAKTIRARSGSNVAPPVSGYVPSPVGGPPSAFHFPNGVIPPPPSVPPPVPPKEIRITPSPSSTPRLHASSARRHAKPDTAAGDETDPSTRFAKLSNASTTSVASALAPSLFSVNSVHSSYSTDGSVSMGSGSEAPRSPARGYEESHGAGPAVYQYEGSTYDGVNITPPTPTAGELTFGQQRTRAHSSGLPSAIIAAKQEQSLPQLPPAGPTPTLKRPSLRPLYTASSARLSSSYRDSYRSGSDTDGSRTYSSSTVRKSSNGASALPTPRGMVAMDMEFPSPPSHTTPPTSASSGGSMMPMPTSSRMRAPSASSKRTTAAVSNGR